jgi:hypothetical protein
VTAQVPNQKIGTPFQNPAWRYEAIKNPEKFNFKDYRSRKEDNANNLTRVISKGLDYTVIKYPKVFNTLPDNLAVIANKIWKSRIGNRVRVENISEYTNFVNWNVKKLKGLNDKWLKRLIKHVFNIEPNPYIAAAIQLHINESYGQIKRFIGYQIFAGEPDSKIAVKWKLPIKTIQALHYIFFDFDYFPKDKVARWALLVQLTNNGDIKQDEFSLYKRVFDLGALGLKAQVCGFDLDDDERTQVTDFLAKSALVNTFNIQFSTRSHKDAIVYNRIISDLARLNVQREELKVKQQEQKLMELHVEKLKREINVGNVNDPLDEDLKLLKATVNELSHKDANPTFKPFYELNTEAQQ